MNKVGSSLIHVCHIVNYKLHSIKDENIKVKIEGDSISTRLYIDDKLIEDMTVTRKYFNAGKDSMNYIRTLVFPLEQSGDYRSGVMNLKIYQK